MLRKGILLFGMTCLMLFQIHNTVFATEQVADIDIPVSNYQESDLDITPLGKNGISAQRSSLASRYISPYVTTVKRQGDYGTCWAFSCMAASEASLIKESLSELNSTDLSELHLAYYLFHSVNDPLGGTEGDFFSVVDKSTNAFLQVGGNQQLATYRLANWYGLVEEKVAAYDSIVKDTKVELPDSLAYSMDQFHLENAYWVSLKDKDIIKQMIMKYGACSASYHTAAAYYSTKNENSSGLEEPVAVYCPQDLNNNHGITIVGWDDNYSRSNFGTYKPASDGAWFCKNSWGAEWSKDGYFWISYEDASLLSEPAYFYDYALADNYEYNYQYDGGAYTGITVTSSYYANRYTAKQAEYLKAVGFYTRNSDYDCKVAIYLDSSVDDPTNGTLVAEQKCPQTYAGFHTVELESPVELKKGETFSVVVYQTDQEGNEVPVILDAKYLDAQYSNTSVACSGQSYVCHDGVVIDVGEEEQANCRIKAYTDKKIFVTGLNLEHKELTMKVDESTSMEVVLEPENASDKGVIWSSGDTSVVSVSEDGIITAVGAGETYVTCLARDGSDISKQCKVTVLQPVEEIRLNYKSYYLTKEGTLQLEATILPEDASDKTVQWISGDESIVIVSEEGLVTAVGSGTTTITCVATDHNRCKATCMVTVTETMLSISLDQATVTLVEGQTAQLNATTNPAIEKTKGIYWLSSNTSIARVDSNGVVTAVQAGGPVTIQCIARDGSGISASCQITVISQEAADDTATEDSSSDNNENANDGNVNDSQTEPDQTKPSDFLRKQYKLGKDGTVQFVDGSDMYSVVTIPSKIVMNGVHYKVTSIAPNAFKDNKKITKVIIDGNIKSIGKDAFRGCSKLKSVVIGKNVKNIGDRAFYKCKSLKSITIKTTKLSKKRVGKSAFKGIHSKATIKVPKKKLSGYKKMLRTKGIGKKVIIKKS